MFTSVVVIQTSALERYEKLEEDYNKVVQENNKLKEELSKLSSQHKTGYGLMFDDPKLVDQVNELNQESTKNIPSTKLLPASKVNNFDEDHVPHTKRPSDTARHIKPKKKPKANVPQAPVGSPWYFIGL